MAVNVTGFVQNPQAAVVTLTVEMPLADWERLLNALNESHSYPQWKLATAIRTVLEVVRSKVYGHNRSPRLKTQENKRMQTLGAEARPIQVAVGSLKSVGSLTQSKFDPENPNKTRYYYNEFTIHGAHGASDMKMRLLWLPDWFNPKFSVKKLDDKQRMVYGRLAGSNDGTPLGDSGFLRGLCGDEDTWVNFQHAMESIEYTPEGVDELLHGFFRDLGPVNFLYEMKQERKKSGVDEHGKNVYQRGKFMEVAAIEHITEKTLKALAKRLERNRKKIADATEKGEADVPVLVVPKFDPADYGFDEIVFPVDAEPAWVTAS